MLSRDANTNSISICMSVFMYGYVYIQFNKTEKGFDAVWESSAGGEKVKHYTKNFSELEDIVLSCEYPPAAEENEPVQWEIRCLDAEENVLSTTDIINYNTDLLRELLDKLSGFLVKDSPISYLLKAMNEFF